MLALTIGDAEPSIRRLFMRIPLTPHGTRELLLFGVPPLLIAPWLATQVHWAASLPLVAIGVFVFSFFRDPDRAVPQGAGEMASPADGKVVMILERDEPSYVKEKSLCVGIFLSVFNVHVNRAPESGTVEFVKYTPGRFLDARDPRCAAENESNAIGIKTDDGRRILVRQVSGLIARRIICTVKEGDHVARGQRIGMIKFGSYTELWVAASAGYQPAVKLEQSVRGAADVVVRR